MDVPARGGWGCRALASLGRLAVWAAAWFPDGAPGVCSKLSHCARFSPPRHLRRHNPSGEGGMGLPLALCGGIVNAGQQRHLSWPGRPADPGRHFCHGKSQETYL